MHYVAVLIMTSQILKSADFTKTKSRYLENEKAKNNFVAEVTFKNDKMFVLNVRNVLTISAGDNILKVY